MLVKIENSAMASVFAAKDTQELASRYAKWAPTYDAENAAAGFRMPQMCSAFFSRHVSVSVKPFWTQDAAPARQGIASAFWVTGRYLESTFQMAC